MNIEIDITTDCNLKCYNCDRQCRQAPSKQMIQLATVEKLVEQSQELDHKFQMLSVLGGEPLLHPELPKILETCRPICNQLRLATNGLIPVDPVKLGLRETDVIENSGKRSICQEFDPVNLAPRDYLDLPKEFYHRACWVTYQTNRDYVQEGYFAGRSFSVDGKYYPCGAGGAIDRVFRLGVGRDHLRDLFDEDIIHWQLEELCSLCGRFLNAHFDYPRICYPKYSPSWEAALQAFPKFASQT